ncbi:MAG TPA: hypothetical protein VG387_17090 [Rhizomicrobium sp.]|jgi:hypothetical protein|nr:hypothetical protein [Rhizomicrobium sp.]
MKTLGSAISALLFLGIFLEFAIILAAFSYGLRMGADLKSGVHGPPAGIPLFVRDDELCSDEGRKHRNRFQGLLLCAFVLAIVLAGGMELRHRIWG